MDKQLLDSLSDYVDLLLDAICAVEKDSTVRYVSRGAHRVFGYTPEEMVGVKMLDLLHPDDKNKTQQSISTVMQDKQVLDFENRYIRKDGEVVHLLWSTSWSEQHQLRLGVARDITRIKQAEAMQKSLLAISEASHNTNSLKSISQLVLSQLAAHIPIAAMGIAIKADGEHQWQTLFESVAGCFNAADEKILLNALNATRMLSEMQDGRLMLLMPLLINEYSKGVLLLILAEDDFVLTPNHHALLSFSSAQIATLIEHQQMLDKLKYLALYDTLTGLPNRDLFQDRMQRALLRARRENSQFALLYLDLDKFKQANDTYGHTAGDALLKNVAQRIKSCVRETDTVVRFGGDEFVVLLDTVENRQGALAAAEKIRLVLSAPYQWQTHQIEMSASIGVSLYPDQGEQISQLISVADEAMYQAKKRGKNCVH